VDYNMGTSAANGFAVAWESQEKQEALMFRRTKMTAAMSQELMDELTDFGRRDLSQLRMDDLESEMYELVDAVTRRAVQGVLEDQTRACSMQDCPRCGRHLEDKPPEVKTLLTQRGEVTWNQPVKHCPTCRCDFFPSGPGVGD
jgi:hypothetical protein